MKGASFLLIFAFVFATGFLSAKALSCYHCYYMEDYHGFDFGDYEFTKNCKSGKLNQDDVRHCGSADPNMTFVCGKVTGTISQQRVHGRGCYPKSLVPPDKKGQCGRSDLDSLWTYFDSLFHGSLGNPPTGNVNTCFCDDVDNCNGAEFFKGSFLTCCLTIFIHLFFNIHLL